MENTTIRIARITNKGTKPICRLFDVTVSKLANLVRVVKFYIFKKNRNLTPLNQFPNRENARSKLNDTMHIEISNQQEEFLKFALDNL